MQVFCLSECFAEEMLPQLQPKQTEDGRQPGGAVGAWHRIRYRDKNVTSLPSLLPEYNHYTNSFLVQA